MSELIQPKVLKGFRDFLPRDEIRRSLLIETVTNVFRNAGFVPIDTPALEYSEVLLRKSNYSVLTITADATSRSVLT